MSLFDIFTKPKGSGALLDKRTPQEKEKDYSLNETVAFVNPVLWTEKLQNQWRKFPIFDQNGSGSCVAQTLAKLLGILYWLKNGIYVHFSATHIYQRRNNKPNGGMAGVDAFDIARKGVTLEVLAPSQRMTDSQMDAVKVDDYKVQVGEIFKIPKYVVLPIGDIDTIASVIQTTKKGVMVWFFFERDEWTNEPIIKNQNLNAVSSSAVRHSVTAVDFTIWKGEKAIVVEDSWGEQFGFGGQRVIRESFFKARNFFTAYPLNFVFDEPVLPAKPSYTFSKDLKFIPLNSKGQISDPIKNAFQKDDVIALQDILKYEKLFPTNISSTGYFGSITAKAWSSFRSKYGLPNFDSGKSVNFADRGKLSQLYQ